LGKGGVNWGIGKSEGRDFHQVQKEMNIHSVGYGFVIDV
jgi:hypothetical protein